MKRFLAVLLSGLIAIPLLPQDQPTFRSSVKLVVVNVTVTSRDGKPVNNLKKTDFQLFEDGKLQTLQTVELQHLDSKPLPPIETGLQVRPSPKSARVAPPPDLDTALSKYQDRRLIVMLFDLSSMQPAEQIRTTKAAEKFISTQLTSSDMVSIMAFSSDLRTLQDFTDDRDQLLSIVRSFHVGEGSELAGMADAGADAEDQSGQFVADETEFNIFNTDRKLMALEDAARKLAPYPEKKALVYFSSGVEKTGVDNQSQLRATINTAVRSNVSFYPIDARGLVALAPGGDASQAGAVGSNLFSGKGQRSLRDSLQNQQETLYSLAADTGGKALLDSNDLTLGMRQVQHDVSSYYILAYASTNSAEDGKYRRIQVKLTGSLAAMKYKLDFRQGYYAPSSFTHMTSADKESQLEQALASENPVTDLPMAVEVDYFRLAKAKYFVPVSVKIPGSALSFKSKGSKAATEMDFIGQVRDEKGRTATAVRDTIPLKVDQTTAGEVGRRQIQYDTGFTLPAGAYTLRFVARENGQGKAGTFEAPFIIPDLASGNSLRISSVILSNQRQPVKSQIAGVGNNKKILADNPLIDSQGNKVVPNVTRVFRPGQTMFVYFEVYDPATPEGAQQNFRMASISSSVALYQNGKKVLETPAVRANRFNPKGDNVLPVRLQASLKDLKPGQYTCQVNVIDELGRKFAFPRTAIAVLDAAPGPVKPAD